MVWDLRFSWQWRFESRSSGSSASRVIHRVGILPQRYSGIRTQKTSTQLLWFLCTGCLPSYLLLIKSLGFWTWVALWLVTTVRHLSLAHWSACQQFHFYNYILQIFHCPCQLTTIAGMWIEILEKRKKSGCSSSLMAETWIFLIPILLSDLHFLKQLLNFRASGI